MNNLLKLIFVVLISSFLCVVAFGQKRPTTTAVKLRSITVSTEPNAMIWLNDLRRGTTDQSGNLTIERVSAGTKRLRVSAKGFAEKTVSVLPTQKAVKVDLVKTTDEAVLAFQAAEEAREKARSPEDKQKVAELFQKALEINPKFAEANLGLARTFESLSDMDSALEQIGAARKNKPNYAEASAVEARILRESGDYDKAIAAANRAVREGKGVQPEALTVLGLTYQDREDYVAAAKTFKQAIAQLDDTEPALYQLLGETYEKLKNAKEAIKAYEKFLEVAPNNPQASSIRSIIEQLKKGGTDIPLPF